MGPFFRAISHIPFSPIYRSDDSWPLNFDRSSHVITRKSHSTGLLSGPSNSRLMGAEMDVKDGVPLKYVNANTSRVVEGLPPEG